MAGRSAYNDDDDASITDINITPFVDVVLVLLVIFIVTARLIVTRGVKIDKTTDAAGGAVTAPLRITVDHNGVIYVNGTHYATDDEAVAKIEQAAAGVAKPRAIIAGDRHSEYDPVMHAIGLVYRAKITSIALENDQPDRK